MGSAMLKNPNHASSTGQASFIRLGSYVLNKRGAVHLNQSTTFQAFMEQSCIFGLFFIWKFRINSGTSQRRIFTLSNYAMFVIL